MSARSARAHVRPMADPRTAHNPARSHLAFVALLLLFLAVEADNLATTLKLAAASGLGPVAERNPVALLAWARFGTAGLVGAKAAGALVALLAAVALYRLGARRRAVALVALAVLWCAALAVLEAWQLVHLPGFYLAPHLG